MRKIFSTVVATLALVACSQLPSLRQDTPASHSSSVERQVAQRGDGALWVTLTLPYPNLHTEGVAPGPDGNMWFTRVGPQSSGVIGKMNMSGVFTEYPYEGTPGLITAGSDGAMWFTEPRTIGRITMAGIITQYHIPYNRATPTGITNGPDGNVWFADIDKPFIAKITPLGVITYYFIPKPNPRCPYGITSGPDGNIWYTDFCANKIGRVTPDGKFTLFTVPTPGSGPQGIVTGADGNLYFTEYLVYPAKLAQITPSGTITQYILPLADNHPVYIVKASSGDSLWILDENQTHTDTQLREFDIHSKKFTTLVAPPAGANISSMDVGPDGNLWFGDYFGPVQVFVTHVLTSNPASLVFPGIGQSQTIKIHETRYAGGSFTAQTSDPSIATVSPGNRSNSFVVVSQGVGSCAIHVNDSLGNSIDVSVTVQ